MIWLLLLIVIGLIVTFIIPNYLLAKKLVKDADALVKLDRGDPFFLEYFTKALQLYRKSRNLCDIKGLRDKINNLDQEINKRMDFQDLYHKATREIETRSYQEALKLLKNASNLFQTSQLNKQINFCEEQLNNKARELRLKADELKSQDAQDPLISDQLVEALRLYQESNQAWQQPELLPLIESLEQEINHRQELQNLFNQANLKLQAQDYKQALELFQKSSRLFSHPRVIKAIDLCQKALKNKATNLKNQANDLVAKDQDNPFLVSNLISSILLYQQAQKSWYQEDLPQIIQNLEREITKRQQFQQIYQTGIVHLDTKYYREALVSFEQAKQLFTPAELLKQIDTCQTQIAPQTEYESSLKQAYQLTEAGRLSTAYQLINAALIKFDRPDGRKLQDQLHPLVEGKKAMKSGLISEQSNRFAEAVKHYQQAVQLIPKLMEAKLRLGIVALKQAEYDQAISYLNQVPTTQAHYYLGVVYSKQQQWEKAKQEWEKITLDQSQQLTQSQRKTVETGLITLTALTQRNRLLCIDRIQQAVTKGDFETAKNYSLVFLSQIGSDTTVQSNLDNHIYPQLEVQFWQSQNWQEITTHAESQWRKQPDLNSLHNWMVASYYSYQTTPTPQNLAKLIIPWYTCLANLQANPILTNIPWLTASELDPKGLITNLQELLVKEIDQIKDHDQRSAASPVVARRGPADLDTYYILRDQYRRDAVALNLVQTSPLQGIRLGDLSLLPGCYQAYPSLCQQAKLPEQIWATLYTDWGLAIAACLEGDRLSGIKLKPLKSPQQPVEKFAHRLLNYHEGCYHLQQNQWRLAKLSLDSLALETEWRQELNQLCAHQRDYLSEKTLTEQIEFAEFWYKILPNSDSQSYLAEHKYYYINNQLANQTITASLALTKIEQLLQIDPHNPVVLAGVEKLKTQQELDAIGQLMDNGKFEQVIAKAKKSHNPQVRSKIARLCLEILLESMNRSTTDWEIIDQLALWAYELDPNDQDTQAIYYQICQNRYK